MLKHLYFILFLTFVTGLAAGVYVFFMTRGDGEGNVPEPRVEEGYEIIAYTYGGCERLGCSSFKLLDDGSYTFITRTAARGNERFDDSVSERQSDELETLIGNTSYTRISESIYTGTCPITYDGIAYRFEIRVESERYSFDSCSESLDSEPLFVLLTKYFDIMTVTHRDQ